MLFYGGFMSDLDRDNTFFTNKKNFFSVNIKNITYESAFESALKFSKSNEYDYIAKNKLFIETEFQQLKTILETSDSDSLEHWLYCYACCMMLQRYYTIYEKEEEAKKCLDARRNMLSKLKLSNEKQLQLNEEIKAEIKKLGNKSLTTTAIRQFLGKTNIQRLVFTFSRLTIRQTLQLAKDLNWLESIDSLLGTHPDVNNMTSIIDGAGVYFNLFSVGLFATRFAINIAMIAKHTFAPNADETKLSRKDRFLKELYDRHYQLLNDLVWGVVNFLCNYNQLVGLSNAFAGWLTAGFLLFDLSLLLVEFHLAEQEYNKQKEQYTNELRHYNELIENVNTKDEDKQRYRDHCEIIEKQLVALDIQRENKIGAIWCDIAAAILLATGFTAALIFASPAVIIASYFVCLLASATYLSDSAFGKYKEKCFIEKQEKQKNPDASIATQERQAARNDFILSMVKYTAVPIALVVVFTICWPAAIVLTAAYLGLFDTVASKVMDCIRGNGNIPKRIETPMVFLV